MLIYANFVLNSFLKYQDTMVKNSQVDKEIFKTCVRKIENKNKCGQKKKKTFERKTEKKNKCGWKKRHCEKDGK